FFFSSRRRHTRFSRDWSSDVCSSDLRWLLSPEGETNLRALPRPERVTLLIGPEGGLAPEERDLAIGAGFTAVRFGPRILRTETAPLAAIAAIQALWGDC